MVVKALTYILTLGKEGIPEAAQNAVLNCQLHDEASCKETSMTMAYDVPAACTSLSCALEDLHHETRRHPPWTSPRPFWITASIPPTMYFPLIVHEALMVEPTETGEQGDFGRGLRCVPQAVGKIYFM